VLAGLLIWFLDVGSVFSSLRDVELPLLAGALVSMLCERFFAAYRWHVLLRVPLPELPYGPVMRVTFVSGFLGTFLPGGSIEVVRVLGLARHTAALASSLGSVVVDRILGIGALIITAFVADAASGSPLPEPIRWLGWASLAGTLVSWLALTGSTMVPLLAGLLEKARIPRLASLARELFTFLANTRNRKDVIIWAIFLAFAIQLIRIATVAFAASAVGVVVPWHAYVVCVPLIIIVQLLPIGVGGLGIREAGFVFFFGFFGVSAELAVAASLAVFGLNIVSSIPGAYYLMAGGSKG